MKKLIEKEVAKSIQKNMNKGKNRSKFQVNQDDGINLDVESGADLDELDYVDDMIDDELSILEEEELQNTHEDVEVNQRNALPLVTQQTTSGKRVDGLVRIGTGQEPKGIVIANKTKVNIWQGYIWLTLCKDYKNYEFRYLFKKSRINV